MTIHGWHEFVAEEDHHLREKVQDAAFVICISDFTRSQLMRQVGPEHWPKLRVEHCGIDPEAFVPSDADAPRSTSVLCVGRLDAEKGHLVLLDALASPPPRRRGHRRVRGHGAVPDGRARRAHLRARARRRGATRRRDRAGRDRGVLTRDAQLFCLPTFIEGLPVVLMEAMGSGVPVVTTPVNGIPELVEDGVTGVLVPPGRSDLLADAIERLLDAPELRASLAKAGRERVLAEFDIHRIGPAIARLFAAAPGARLS